METSIGAAFSPLIDSPPAIICFAHAMTFSVPVKSFCWNPFIIAAPKLPTSK